MPLYLFYFFFSQLFFGCAWRGLAIFILRSFFNIQYHAKGLVILQLISLLTGNGLISLLLTGALNFHFIPFRDSLVKGKGKLRIHTKWPIRPALTSCFCSMKGLGVFLLSTGWDASLSHGYPQHRNTTLYMTQSCEAADDIDLWLSWDHCLVKYNVKGNLLAPTCSFVTRE